MPFRPIRRVRRSEQGPEERVLASLLPADQRHRASGPEVPERLRSMAHPRFYAAQPGVPADLAGNLDGAVDHFLAAGAREGARISALFHEETYRKRCAELDETLDGHPFFHWLTVGWDRRIVPTPLFDEDFYVASHPDVARGPEWSFAQFVRAGCYAPARRPGRFGPAYGSVAVPYARTRQEPVLLAGMLHRADAYDLRRTSWLEEGVGVVGAKLDGLAADRMRDLVDRAAAIEPLIRQPEQRRWVSWAPHLHRKVVTAHQAEEVRRAVGITRADTVVLLPGLGRSPAKKATEAMVGSLADAEDDHTALVLLVDPEASPGAGTWDGPGRAVDLTDTFEMLAEDDRLLCLVDVVRGLRCRRLVVADSLLGWTLVTAYGTTLQNEMSIGAFLSGSEADGHRSGYPVRQLQECFDRLTWVVLADVRLRDDLVERYVLPEASRAKLLVGPEPDRGTVAALRELESEAGPHV